MNTEQSLVGMVRTEAAEAQLESDLAKIEDSPWIEWAGGEMPVAPETRVIVEWPNGSQWVGFRADQCPWNLPCRYQVLSAPQPEQIAEEALPQSKTSRVNAQLNRYTHGNVPPLDQRYVVMCDLARQLERELSEAKDRAIEHLKMSEEIAEEAEALRTELAALKARDPAASMAQSWQAAEERGGARDDLLGRWLAYATEPAGMTPEIVFNKDKWTAFNDALDAQQAALIADTKAALSAQPAPEQAAKGEEASEIVRCALRWYDSSSKEVPAQELSLAVLRYKQSQEAGS